MCKNCVNFISQGKVGDTGFRNNSETLCFRPNFLLYALFILTSLDYMTRSIMNSSSTKTSFTKVACPFCGIHCDDLEITATGNALQVKNTTCFRAVEGFERHLPAEISPRINGEPVALDKAITKAANIIKKSGTPLFAGLGTDVSGHRNILQTADKVGGIVDHVLSEGIMRNILALSDRGWITTTLTEIRNRADLVVFVGTDATEHPRFHERILWAKEAMFVAPADREIVYLGKKLDTKPGISPKGKKPMSIPCDISELSTIMNTLTALIEDKPLQAKKAGGAKVTDLKKLADKIITAEYAVFIWSPPKLNFPNAELVVGAVSDLVRKLTETKRAAGFALGGDDGAASAAAVCAWQTGYPLRTNFSQGYPDYNPSRYSTNEILTSGQADALVWVSTFTSNRLPPESNIPTIVIGEPGMKFKTMPDVFIPAGTPGIDHVGKIVRVDSVVSLPMKQLRNAGLPSVASIFDRIYQAL